MKKQSSESFELYFNMLNDDALKNEQAYQTSKTYLNSDKEYDEVRSEVLKIEEIEKICSSGKSFLDSIRK